MRVFVTSAAVLLIALITRSTAWSVHLNQSAKSPKEASINIRDQPDYCRQWDHTCDQCVRHSRCYYCSSDGSCKHNVHWNEHTWYNCNAMSDVYWWTCSMNVRLYMFACSMTIVAMLFMVGLFAYVTWYIVQCLRERRRRWEEDRNDQATLLDIRRLESWQRKHQFIDKYSTVHWSKDGS